MDTCTTEHLRTEFKAKHNIRIFLSTSAYELVKKRLPEHLSEYINKDNLDMTTEMGLDSNNAEVELPLSNSEQTEIRQTRMSVKIYYQLLPH